jgi:hypothetical protein
VVAGTQPCCAKMVTHCIQLQPKWHQCILEAEMDLKHSYFDLIHINRMMDEKDTMIRKKVHKGSSTQSK